MGLDTSHGCWHGAYSAFSRFRQLLAEAAGYDIVQDKHYRYADLQWDQFTEENLQGEWDRYPEDPLIVLLAHSDCDGYIDPDIAPHLADRIEDLIPELPDWGAGHLYNPRAQAKRFAEGLREAASKKEQVQFH